MNPNYKTTQISALKSYARPQANGELKKYLSKKYITPLCALCLGALDSLRLCSPAYDAMI